MQSKGNSIQTALVLGGGGVRGLAHLGALEVLVQNNIPIDLIVGTSIGAIIGGLYAEGNDISTLKQELLKLNKKDLIEFSIISAVKSMYDSKHSFLQTDKLEKLLTQYIKNTDIADLQTKFIAIATNLENGKIIALDKGNIIQSIRASYAIPWLFPAVEMYGMKLVDGGVAAPLAVDIAKQHNPLLTIAVELVLPIELEKSNNPLTLVMKSMNISYNNLSHLNAKQADIVIRPQLPKDGLFSDKFKHEIYEAGVAAAEKALPQIKAQLQKHTPLIQKIKNKIG